MHPTVYRLLSQSMFFFPTEYKITQKCKLPDLYLMALLSECERKGCGFVPRGVWKAFSSQPSQLLVGERVKATSRFPQQGLRCLAARQAGTSSPGQNVSHCPCALPSYHSSALNSRAPLSRIRARHDSKTLRFWGFCSVLLAELGLVPAE